MDEIYDFIDRLVITNPMKVKSGRVVDDISYIYEKLWNEEMNNLMKEYNKNPIFNPENITNNEVDNNNVQLSLINNQIKIYRKEIKGIEKKIGSSRQFDTEENHTQIELLKRKIKRLKEERRALLKDN